MEKYSHAHKVWGKITYPLTHWGRVTHICVGNLAIIDSDNGLSPGRRQAIIWPNAGILLIGSLGTNFSEIWIGIQTFSSKKIHLKMSSAKWRLFCLGLNVLRQGIRSYDSNMKCTDNPTCANHLHANKHLYHMTNNIYVHIELWSHGNSVIEEYHTH